MHDMHLTILGLESSAAKDLSDHLPGPLGSGPVLPSRRSGKARVATPAAVGPLLAVASAQLACTS